MKAKTKQASLQETSVFEEKIMGRREFMSRLAIGGGSLVLLSGCAGWVASGTGKRSGEKIYQFIAVDYTKCTGCRTCEAVCAAANHPLYRESGYRSDLGNPILSNIRVHSYNPDVDAPVTCARCGDTPCINACPVEPDPASGRRALYQDTKMGVITNDTERCIACGSCVEACSTESVGILARHPETEKPIRMCTLCDGAPQCVEHCPYDALSVLTVKAEYPFYRMAPEDIARKLHKRWYDISA